MNRFSLSHLSDQALHRGLADAFARERVTTARLLADIAEMDARRVYELEGYPSMLDFCVHRLHMDEDELPGQIEAARVGRRFPALFPAVAEGRLHVEAIVLLGPYLTEESAEELIAAATHMPESEIGRFLAGRFPQGPPAGSDVA